MSNIYGMNISMNGSNCDRSANFMQTTPKKSKTHDSFTQLVSPNINSGGTLLLKFDNGGKECNDHSLKPLYIFY